MDPTDYVDDWDAQVVRAYTVFGVDPTQELDEFGFLPRFPRLSTSFLRQKAEQQLRDRFGKWREERGTIVPETRGDIDAWSPPTKQPLSLVKDPKRAYDTYKERAFDVHQYKRIRDKGSRRTGPEQELMQEILKKYGGTEGGVDAVRVWLQQFVPEIEELLWSTESSETSKSQPASPETPRGSGFDLIGYTPGTITDPKVREEVSEKVMNGYLKYLQTYPDVPMPMSQYIQRQTEKAKARILGQTQEAHTRIPTYALKDIIETDAVKTQFETKHSVGAYNPDYRQEFEARSMDVPEGQPPHLRPVYGYLGEADDEHSLFYGDIALTLNDAAVDRTTVTPLDSLNTQARTAVPLRKIQDGTADPGDILGTYGDELRSLIENNLKHLEDNELTYVETQTHGGITLGDIEKITFSPPQSALSPIFDKWPLEPSVLQRIGPKEARETVERFILKRLRDLGMDMMGTMDSGDRALIDRIVNIAMPLAESGRFVSVGQSLPESAELIARYLIQRGADPNLAIEFGY